MNTQLLLHEDSSQSSSSHTHSRYHTHNRTNDNGSRAAIQVRSNISSNLRERYSLVALAFSVVLSAAEVCAQLTVLVITWDQSCMQPLREWVILRVLLQSMSFPLTLYLGTSAPGTSHAGREISTSTVRVACRKLAGALHICSCGWFLVGNVWTLQAESCATTSPYLYRLCLVLIIVFYASLALPYVFGLCLLCCLPFFIASLSHIAESGLGGRGASQDTINSLQQQQFRPASMSKEDAVCVICLGEYEVGEYVRTLPCKHAYHSSCIDRWLIINRNCPLCQRNILADEET
mmetsp:Transcript_16775/g.27550  ORF Transcript_16775/g.27550 Transcript_16775/m.27550 type:complete len:291 (-) Transcript_16775:87-959(-)